MFGLGKKKVKVRAVFAGTAVSVAEIPDPVFSGGMLGEGFAVVPPAEATTIEVGSPVAGTLTKVFKTGHAFVVTSSEGLEVLVHIGLETVELKGAGFTILAQKGDTVEAGTAVVRLDLDVVRQAGLNPITPVVFATKKQVGSVATTLGDVNAGDVAATVTLA
ncbi:PTS sugar transporter subunit IIA [Trueperella pecoris]|uniref:PTS sugar transporter subunit IIA n=1 Tax=Trueperella pecoris TaxID=2733571 RepID=UPI001ABE14F8|nr:PTS glucose transporter subunit IIA [Trueperella pecoris]QTG75253.1 PTS glucose transporter subunit IIA [Trueperella pecoris]